MLEAEIERKLHTKLKQLDKRIKCLKFVSPGYTGVPDRIILLPGAKVIFAELKKPGKKERVRQLYVQGLIKDLGFEVYSSVDSFSKVDAIVERCREVLQHG